jgi:hypothetical protein
MEPIEFRAMSKRLSLHLQPETPYFDANGLAHITPARIVTFQEGRYVTEDEKVAELIRQSGPFKRHEIAEITDKEKDIFIPPAQKTHRGAISTLSLHEEAGNKQELAALSLKEAVAVCDFPGCGKEFSGIRAKSALALHKVSHRKALRVEAK